MNNSKIGYTTEIVIKKYHDDELLDVRTYHNTGTWNLFNVICRALVGYSIATLIPDYLDLRYSDEGNLDKSVLKSPVACREMTLDTVPSGEDTMSFEEGCSLYVSFAIYGDNLDIPSAGNADLYYTLSNSQIFSAYTTGVLAVLDSGYDFSSFGVAIDEMLLVEWKMTFENEQEN